MNAQEFNDQFKAKIARDLPKAVEWINGNILDGDNIRYDKLRDLASDLKNKSLDTDLVPDVVDELSILGLELQRDDAFNDKMLALTHFLQADEEFSTMCKKMAAEGGTDNISSEELDYITNIVIRNEELLLEPIRYILDTPEYRTLLNSDTNFEEFAEKFRAGLSEANSFDDLVNSPDLGILGSKGLFFSSLGVVAVAAIVSVAAVIHTVAVAVNYAAAVTVTVAAAVAVVTANGPINPFLGFGSTNEKGMTVHNCSGQTIWVTAKTSTGTKKFPIKNGFSSIHTGIINVAAILVGGNNNALTNVSFNGKEVSTDITTKKGVELEITISEKLKITSEHSEAIVVSNDNLFEQTAEAYPKNFNVEKFMKSHDLNERFYQSLRTEPLLKSISQITQ